MQRLVEFLELEVCLEDTTLVEAGDVGSETYFIHKGFCAVLGRGDAGVIRTYTEGDCFGVAPILAPQLRATNTVKARPWDVMLLGLVLGSHRDLGVPW